MCVEPADVSRVMPTVSERVVVHLRLRKIPLKHDGSSPHDLSGGTHGNLIIVVVDKFHLAHRAGLSCGPQAVTGALDGDETARLGLPEPRPEISVGLRVEPLDGVGRIEAIDMSQAR